MSTISNDKDELLEMSNSLDQLGWKKVFVKMPISVNIPRLRKKKKENIFLSLSSSHGDSSHSSDSGEMIESSLASSDYGGTGNEEEKDAVGLESKDVKFAVSSPHSMHFPFAHNMMVAFARGRVSRARFKAGRPLMNDLAKEFVNEIIQHRIIK